MQEIPWERTTDGRHAFLAGKKGVPFIPALLLWHLATEKMMELSVISADFEGRTQVFSQQLGVYLETRHGAEYWGVYASDPPTDEEVELAVESHLALPTLCLRHCLWDRKADIQKFLTSPNKRAYVQGKEQLDCRVVFVTSEAYPEVSDMLEEVEQIVYQGISIEQVERAKPQWNILRLKVAMESGVVFSLSYNLPLHKSEEVENWIEKWGRCLARFTSIEGVIPDQGCFISYPDSLMERLERFPE